MGEKLLEEFYYGIMPSEMCYPRKKEYKQIMQLCQKTEDELKNNFTPEMEKIFEKLYFLRFFSKIRLMFSNNSTLKQQRSSFRPLL